MTVMRHVDSPRNAEVKALLRLKDRRERDREGLFLIEGRREVTRAVQANVRLRTLYICETMSAPAGMTQLIAELGLVGVETVRLSEAAFLRLSMRENPDGALALAETWQLAPEDIDLPGDPLLLVIDGLEKPGNLGALLRTADSAGADAVFVTGAGTDLFNPNVVRASMGSLFARPVTQVGTDQLLAWLRRRGWRIVATSPGAHSSYWDADLTGGCAIVLGTEHDGLPMSVLEAADEQVLIPMHGMADSLNVATAGALLLYEALRQRGG